MSKTSSRDIKKRLFEFARNEFETKKPEYVEVRKAKGTKTFYRGPVPQLILTRYKAIAYTVFADFGTLCRLYYFNRDGYCIRDSSYSDQQLDKIKTHLKKTTTRVLRYPKIEAKPKIGNLSVKLDNRFAEIIDEIEKLTKQKLPSRPIITLSKNLELNKENFLSNIVQEDEFIELPFEIEKTELAEIALVHIAFFEFTRLIFDNILLAKDRASQLSLFFINDEKLLDILIEYLGVSSYIPKNFNQLNRRKELGNLIEILTDYNEYLLSRDFVDYDFNSSKRFDDKILYCLLHEFTIESDPKIRFAKALLREIPLINAEKEQDIAARLLIVVAFLELNSKTKGGLSSQTLEITKSITGKSEIVLFARRLVTDLSNFHIESFINFWRKNKHLYPESVETKFDELTDIVFKKVIELYAEFTANTFDKPGDIIITIRNKSDANLGTLVAEEIHWTPVEAMEIIGEKRKIRAKSLAPDEEYTLTVPIIPKKEGTINFRNLMIRFNDPFGIKHFVSLPIPSLKIKKK